MTDVAKTPVDRPAEPPDMCTSGPKPAKICSQRGARLFGLGVLVLLAGGIGLGSWQHLLRDEQVMAAYEQHRDRVPTFNVATVEPADSTVQVSLPGTTAAYATANIFARASGYIEKRPADIGDRVKEGQLLAEISAPELDHQIAQAEATLNQTKASLQQTQANLDLAKVTWSRDEPLVKKGWVTPQQGTIDVQNIKALEAALGVAKANIDAQQAQLKVLYQQKAYTKVVAPYDGVITQRNIDVGSLVQADTTTATFMFTIMQSKVIRVQVYVPQDKAFGLEPGVIADIRVPEIAGRTFPGKVTRIADALQPNTRTLLSEIDVPNPDGALASGIYCTVDLHIPRKVPSLVVPSGAIVFNSDGLSAAVLEDGVARFRKISIGRDFGATVEVRDGLKPGDHVILNPSVDLADGNRVAARPAAVARNN